MDDGRMARWDEILSLPVQNPSTLEFAAADLVWSKIEGWRDNIDRLALIPFARVDDFVRGESANKDCPTRFHVEARRRRPPETAYKQKVDGILEYILYWCSFGPDDHRKGGIVRPSRTTYVPKKKNAGRPNTKRGTRRLKEPVPFAPYISEDLRLRVLSLLYVGVSVETIMQRHNESVEKQGGPCNRDDLLTHRYVRRQERSIRRSTYELDTDDSVSISMWVESHQSHVFFYEDFSDSDPFTLGIQTEWQLQQMIRFGNRSLLASDSRFGTNKLKYPVHSLVVFNSDKKAIPVAWIITPRFATADAHRWMRALYNRVRTKDPTWKLAGFIVDDPLTDILTIRDVFQCSVLISFWRVRHAWQKNLVKRCSETEMRVQMFRQLGEAVDDICRGHGTKDLFEAFMEDFIDGSDFMDYFKAVWHPRVGMWTTVLKTLPLASQETCAAMELYHNQLKVRLLNEKDPIVYQRADWLVDKLGTKVHSYFWLDEYSEKDDFARYWKDEWDSGLTAWSKALKIPDLDVIIEGRCAKVTDQLDRDRVHVVWNPGSDFAICDCNWAEMGNICEHVFKVIACATTKVAVQKQLDALVDFDNGDITVDPIQKDAVGTLEQTGGMNYANHDRELVNECHLINEDVSSHNRDDCGDGDKGRGGVTGDFCESIGEETTCTEMDVDPSSNCIPSPRLCLFEDVVTDDVFMENRGKTVNDTGPSISKSPPKDEVLTDQVGLEHDSIVHMEPPSMDIPPSLAEFMGQSVTNQNNVCSNSSELSVITNTSDAVMVYKKASPSLSKAVERTDDWHDSNFSDKPPPIEATIQEAGSHEEKSLRHNLVSSSCTLQKSAATGKSDTSQSDIVDGTVVKGIDSGGTVNAASVASKGSDKCHRDIGVEASDADA
ncbi:hypothetical protein GH714_019085 [Hevea brasiliensis]|uniref:SWIM-type domain-containing protein n=1 Tax=Hevea brasiliensis TaxID=3981 RepID=A0A6A6LTH8_HEVBR|nr:hypothetical protein GH714_019085 [Hevea brasiliensis]